MSSNINLKLYQILLNSKKKKKERLNDNELKKRINSRKNLKKFGKAVDNRNVTNISKNNIFIEQNEKTNNGKEEKILTNTKLICRYCNGSHLSFKCKNKNNNKKSNTIKMSNLPNDISEEELYDLLQDYGLIEKVKIPEEFKNKSGVKYAYIRLGDCDTASIIKEELDQTNFDNHIIGVTYSNSM